nr:MAR-binding filament-like protein 1-1 [Leptinotarsa decemlineata]
MSDFNGEDLLKVFKDLDVQLLNLNRNVVMGWFDTDDKNMKNLLNWMCTSLSVQNYVSPLENGEYKHLSSVISREKQEYERDIINDRYPGIFDPDTNELEVEYLQDEIELMQEEEDNLNEIIRINRLVDNNLRKELDKTISLEIKSSLQLKNTQEKCLAIGEKLDDLNGKIHEKLLKYGRNLHDFEFSPIPNFINNMDIKVYQDKVENITSMLMPVLDDHPVSVSLSVASNATSLEVTNINETVSQELYSMRHRILHSRKKFLATKIEVEKLKEMCRYLDKVTVESLLSPTDSLFLQENIESKKESRRMMCGMLDKIATDFADQQISLTQQKYVEKELEIFQSRLNNLSKIEHSVMKLMSHYLVLSILYIQEKKDIDCSDNFFRKVIHYISQDLENCLSRTGKINRIIQEYNSHSPEERFTLIRSIIKMLSSSEETFTITKAFEVICELKKEIDMLENRLFSFSFDHYRSTAPDLKESIKILQRFLVCGPTHRVVLVPSDLNLVIREAEEMLKRQLASVKSAVDISSSAKRIPNKWQNYRRQLWMYFYVDPQKLKYILHQIEEAFAKSDMKKN